MNVYIKTLFVEDKLLFVYANCSSPLKSFYAETTVDLDSFSSVNIAELKYKLKYPDTEYVSLYIEDSNTQEMKNDEFLVIGSLVKWMRDLASNDEKIDLYTSDTINNVERLIALICEYTNEFDVRSIFSGVYKMI